MEEVEGAKVIVGRSWFDADSVLFWSRRCCLGVMLGVLGAGLALLAISREEAIPWVEEGVCVEGVASFHHEAIGRGVLALNPAQAFGWVGELAKQLVLIGYNSRPDVGPEQAQIVMGVKGVKGEQSLLCGQRVVVQQEAWMKPLLLDPQGVLVEVGKTLEGKELTGRFFVRAPAPSSLDAQMARAVQACQSARFLGRDLLIDQYGGKEYQSWKAKAKIEFAYEGRFRACFVGLQDRLVWKGGEWRDLVSGEEGLGAPLAEVEVLSANNIILRVWDSSGFASLPVELDLVPPSRQEGQGELIVSAAQMRTPRRVSCLVGKKRMIIRQGDWLVKSGGTWRVLRKKEEIEALLHHRIRGELFILDRLEKERGKWMLKGTVFDETRQLVRPLSVAVEAQKKKGRMS